MGKVLTHIYLWLVEAQSIRHRKENSHVLTRAEFSEPLGVWFC